MYSTPKIALESACAGPSWISWARRVRSASRASTIRIWRSSASSGAAGSARSDASPRSRKSQVRSRPRTASSRRASSAWRSPSSDVPERDPALELGGRPVRAAGLVQGVTILVPAGQVRVECLAVASRPRRAGCSPRRRAPPSPPREGCRTAPPRPRRRSQRSSGGQYTGAHGQATRKTRKSSPSGPPVAAGGTATGSQAGRVRVRGQAVRPGAVVAVEDDDLRAEGPGEVQPRSPPARRAGRGSGCGGPPRARSGGWR